MFAARFLKLADCKSSSRRAWRVFAGSLLVAGVAAAGARAGADVRGTSASTISLAVDYNDGASKVFALPWKQDMTVLDALNLAKTNRHGIRFVTTGSGDTTFVTGIDDLKNEGAGAAKKNWLFSVNEKLAERSCGTYQLRAGDRVVWKFAVYQSDDGTNN
jgi:hypothetical protein